MINGFTRSWHPFQVTSYVLFFDMVVNLYFCIYELRGAKQVLFFLIIHQVVTCIIFTVVASLTGYFAIMTTAIDPSDDIVISQKLGKINQQTHYLFQEKGNGIIRIIFVRSVSHTFRKTVGIVRFAIGKRFPLF